MARIEAVICSAFAIRVGASAIAVCAAMSDSRIAATASAYDLTCLAAAIGAETMLAIGAARTREDVAAQHRATALARQAAIGHACAPTREAIRHLAACRTNILNDVPDVALDAVDIAITAAVVATIASGRLVTERRRPIRRRLVARDRLVGGRA
jgi:hypothetical protein